MTGTPAVSVIIPTRNRRGTLGRAIASALAQSLPPTEIIVIDDASTDGTVQWLQTQYPTTRLIALEVRGGAPRARNRGIEAAQGEFIAFLDSDDAFFGQKIERQIAAMQAGDAAFSTCGFADPGGRRYCTTSPRPGQILRRNCLGGTSGLVARREVLRTVRFDPELKAVQDWDLYLRLLEQGAVAHVPEALYLYGTGGDDRITRNARHRFLGHAALWRRHIRTAGRDWRTRKTHRALLHMLACDALGRRGSTLFWRLLYRFLAG